MISIIIPLYNVEKYIEATLRSILNQTYKEYEIILVDDGSVDDSLSVAEKTLEEKSFRNYIVLKEKNSGQGVARNYGMTKASGDWIFFMDADDLLPKYAFEKLVSAAETENADMTFCGFKFSKGELIEENISNYSVNTFIRRDIQYGFLTRKKKILVPGTLFSAKWLREYNVEFPGIRFSEDIYFLWNTLGVVNKVAEVEGCLYTYVVRENSTMTGSKKYKLIDGYMAFQELYERIQKDSNIIPEVKKWMLSRWVLGVLRIATNLMSWEEFRDFAEEISYKKWCEKLKDFPDFKVKVLSILASRHLKLYYIFLARLYPR